MNTIQLECFIAVAQHMNFSRAADELKITQPAVSHQIRTLEEELDVKLFKRTSREVALTPEGIQEARRSVSSSSPLCPHGSLPIPARPGGKQETLRSFRHKRRAEKVLTIFQRTLFCPCCMRLFAGASAGTV